MSWSELFSGLIGALIGGVCSVGAVWWQSSLQRRAQNANEDKIVRGYLQSILTEIDTLWARYSDTAGKMVEVHPDNQPFLYTWAVAQDYFTIYTTNGFILGRVPDPEIREAIVRCYTAAKGLLDGFRLNNEMVQKFESFIILNVLSQVGAPQTPQAQALGQLHQRHVQQLTQFAHTIKQEHENVKQKVISLRTSIRRCLGTL